MHGNTHVIDHADDVFDLVRVGDVGGQVIIDFRVGQITLLFTAGNQLLELRLLLFFISRHEVPISVQCAKNAALYRHRDGLAIKSPGPALGFG